MAARSLLLLFVLLCPANLLAQGEAAVEAQAPEVGPLEHLEAPCAAGDGAKCLEAANAWYFGQGVDKSNHLRAVNLYQAACAFEAVQGCLRAAQMYLSLEAGMQLVMPEGTPSADLDAAAQQLRFACELGDLPACGRLGDMFVNPAAVLPDGAQYRGIEQDYFYAAQAYQSGCNEAGVPEASDVRPDGKVDARSCARLGELHERGAGVMRSAEFAANLFDRACRAGASAWCAKADEVRQAVADGTWVHPDQEARAEHRETAARGDGHLGSISPDTERFKDPALGIGDRKREAGVRLDMVGMMGSRWFYGPPKTLGGVNFKAGLTVWVKLIGFGFETGFNTDRLFFPSGRYYARYTHALVVKGIFPLPIKLPIPASLALSVGAGPLLGHQRFETVPFFLFYGAREHVQIQISTPQRRGPRQWGAFRFEQQQTWLSVEQRTEHSSQVMFLFGFTFGGVAPEYPGGKGRTKEDITDRDTPRPNWIP
jgi:hypothetical protein